MEGVKKIKQRILKDAEKQVKELEKSADERVKEVEREGKERRKAYERHYQERTEALVNLLEQKTLAQARLEDKKALLRERERIIDSFIEKAATRGKEYEEHLKRVIEAGKKQLGEVTVTCNKQDEALVKKHAKHVEVGDVDFGVILTDKEGKKLDETLASLLERKRNEIRQEVATLVH